MSIFSSASTSLEPVGSGFNRQGLAQMSGSMQRQARREIERVQAQALVAVTREQGRAFLTEMSLENVGTLTALEQLFIQAAPLGEARYRAIVDAHTIGATSAILRV